MFYVKASILTESRSYKEADALKLFNLLFADRLFEAHRATQQRRAHIRQITEFAEDGRVAIVTNGMDCDCSAWENSVSLVPATLAEVDVWLDDFYGSAEGPQGHYLERPSVARQLKRSSRDLALEAFEDGHPHFISYGASDVAGNPDLEY